MSGTVKVLLIDDNPMILGMLSQALGKFAALDTASDSAEGLLKIVEAPPDLLITDYQMPGMSGLDLARKLHNEPGKRNLPAMLLTAHGLALEQVELAHAGITVCLSKPFSPRDLLEKVNELIAQRDQVPEAAPAA